jgi:hypothetical protein
VSGAVHLDASDAFAGLAAMRAAIHDEVSAATFQAGAMGQTIVRAAASTGTHRPREGHIAGTGPGPNVATGDYRRAISVTNEHELGQASSDVGTNAAQAARLEYGFVGLDSAGRHYQQRPYPHWEPSGDLAEEAAVDLMDGAADAIERAFGG